MESYFDAAPYFNKYIENWFYVMLLLQSKPFFVINQHIGYYYKKQYVNLWQLHMDENNFKDYNINILRV